MYTSEDFSSVRDREAVRREMPSGTADRAEYAARYGMGYGQRRICGQLWISPQINWDGRVLGCCVNHWGDFGNAFRDGLAEILGGEAMTYARSMLMGRTPPRDDIPCTTCVHYTAMRTTGRWLTTGDVTPARRLERTRRLIGRARRALRALSRPAGS